MILIMHSQPHTYPVWEERINIASHALGLILSIVGIVFLLFRAIDLGGMLHVVSFSIFGVSLVLLYTASTVYHSAASARQRRVMRTFDHASIYVLIAGTYTPFTLIVLPDFIGWVIFATVWSMACIGIVIKIFFTGRFDHLSTLMYVLMGWIIIFAIKPLANNFSPEGIRWLIAGGVLYTVGALFYSIKKMPFGHATFHIFVLAGSACHFVSVYVYILDLRVIIP